MKKDSKLKKMVREILNEGRYREVTLKLKNGNEVTISGNMFQSGTVPDPSTSHLDMLRILKMKGYSQEDAYPYKVLKKESVSGEELIGGVGDTMKPQYVDQNELAVGIEVEKEHTDSNQHAQEIAMDHLTEDPKYYSKLLASGLADEESAIDKAKEVGITEDIHYVAIGGVSPAPKINKNIKNESKVGDAFIEIGEAIEDIDKAVNRFKNLAKKMHYHPSLPILNKLKHNILDLKKLVGDSYEF